jgi:membrane protease YdiL (CAAX protease family)
MKHKNSLLAVNILFLIVLILQASNLLFLWIPQYIRLTLNQAFFVFLPAYLYLRLNRQPIKTRVGWHWPGWKAGLLALLLGMGLYPLSAVSGAVLQQILGYTEFVLPADAIPTTMGMALLAIIAYSVMAPLCEEFLFRGVIQPVYERRSPRSAIVFVGLLFVLFHLSLLQGLSIVLLSLALGFVYYRTRSLQASILTHFGANLLAALVLIQTVFPTGIAEMLFAPVGILAGLAVAVLAFLGLVRYPRSEKIDRTLKQLEQETEAKTESRHQRPPSRRETLAAWWPILAAGLLYLGFIGAEVIFARSPELAVPPLQAAPLPLVGEQTRRYDIYNVADELVGVGECCWPRMGR